MKHLHTCLVGPSLREVFDEAVQKLSGLPQSLRSFATTDPFSLVLSLTRMPLAGEG